MSATSSPGPGRRDDLLRGLLTAGLAVGLAAALLVGGTLLDKTTGPGTRCTRLWNANPTTATPIHHLFVIVKENHAFENYFGTRPGVTGYPPSGSFPVSFSSGQTISPFPLPGVSTPDLPHDEGSDLVDYNGGANDLFVAQANASGAQAPEDAVGYYGASQIPSYFAYADAYALGDHFFTGKLGPTAPNRVFNIAAQNSSWDADSPPSPDVPVQPTILGQLTQANLPWEYDTLGTPAGTAPTWFPALTNDPCSLVRISSTTNLARQLASSTPPAVVYLDPSTDGTYSEHPPQNVTLGSEWTVAAVNTIFASAVASSSAVLIFFDENGGFWDPVPPPMTSTGRDGFRVPFLVLSPWTPAGKVCPDLLDPAAVLRFVDANWGLPYLNPRVASAPDLSCFFDFSLSPRPPLVLPTNVSLGSFGGFGPATESSTQSLGPAGNLGLGPAALVAAPAADPPRPLRRPARAPVGRRARL